MGKIVFILALLVIVLSFVAIVLIGKIHATKRKARKVSENANIIIEKERENEKRKEKLNNTNHADAFNSSLELLQDLDARR